MVKLHRRIQDPAFSDYQTLRVDTIGDAALLGRVYLSTSTGGRPLDLVRCHGHNYLAYRAQDGRLYVDSAPSALLELAERASKTRRPARGRGYYAGCTVRPLPES